MGWGLLVGSTLHCWHYTGQKLLLLRKIPKLNCNSGLWVYTFNLAGFVTYLCSESLQQLLIISACPLPSTRLSVKEREELPVPQCQWHGRGGVLSPGRDSAAVAVCYLNTVCGERQRRDLAGAQPESSSEQVGRCCCFVSLLGAPASAKPSCSPLGLTGAWEWPPTLLKKYW